MAQGLVLVLLVLAAFFLSMLVMAGLQIGRTLASITKCPDCGRIMQHVLYTENEGFGHQQIQLECPFCQSKQIRRIQRGKKLTMYP
ncbi:MAG: hypothetical protein JWN30_94 [Bacilli bacterium]|nr:hypothetical protein [Bacilli bacterium]